MKVQSAIAMLLAFVPLASAQPGQKPASASPAAQVAVKPPVERAWETLRAGMAENKGAERSDAVTALGSIGTRPDVVKLIESALDDKSSEVRRVAAATLGEMKSRASIPRLQQALDDESIEVSFTAARALWEMGDRSGRSLFQSVLSGDRKPTRGPVRARWRDAKETLGDPKALTMIGVKHGAGALLGPFAMGISVVEEFARDGSGSTRALCADLLSEDRDPDTLADLLAALEDKNWVVRAAAARALGLYGNRAALPRLEHLLNDDKDAVKYMAAAAIVRLTLAPSRR